MFFLGRIERAAGTFALLTMRRVSARESRLAARRSLGKFKLDCRLDGRDCEIEVGKPPPGRGGVVVAVLDHGREQVFAVYTDRGGGDVVRVGRHVYAVTEFA
jgi:hypothetical protein